MKPRWVAIGVLVLGCGPLAAQNEPGVSAPRTLFEEFGLQEQVVILTGSSTIGAVRAGGGGRVSVESLEITNVASARKERGIAVEVKVPGTPDTTRISYVDEDEIEALLKGLDVLVKINASSSRLDHVRAGYRTRGDLVVSAFVTGAGIRGVVSCGSEEAGPAAASLGPQELDQFRILIADAKRKLDAIR